MDRFSELRAYAAVVEAGGFSAAARALGTSRSSVNRLVIALEERLGAQLLHRTTRNVSANSTGQAFYDRARQVLDDLDEMERAVSSTRTEPVGKLRISAPPSFGDLDFSE
ncbi:MAG: LysR family transcriptional regulator, partial [Pseudomonadota bacterium]